jgi:hypothetical protein
MTFGSVIPSLVSRLSLECQPASGTNLTPALDCHAQCNSAFFHAPRRLIRTARHRVVRIIDGWPGADVLVTAYERIEAITERDVGPSAGAPPW